MVKRDSAKSETRSGRAVPPQRIWVQVQPVNAGTTDPESSVVVVVVVGGTGPVNESTNVSYNGWFDEPLYWMPVATQNDTETHDTEYRTLPMVLGLGLVTVDQTLPFHCSTNVRLFEPLFWVPVATQKDTETHDTEFRELLVVPGLGLVTVDQTLPFHCSTNVGSAEPLYW